jgi:3-dehydroquinate synthetase
LTAEIFLPAALRRKRAVVISNDIVAPLYAARVLAALDSVAVAHQLVVLPDGEAHKDWPTLNLIFDALLGAQGRAFDYLDRPRAVA